MIFGTVVIGVATHVATSLAGPAMIPLITTQTIQTVATIVGPIIGVVVSFLIWIHKRIDALENEAVQTRGALFGNESNPMQEGISAEIKEMETQLQQLEQKVDWLERENKELKSRTDTLYNRRISGNQILNSDKKDNDR